MDLLSQYLMTTKEEARSKAAIAMYAGIDYIAEKAPGIASTILQELSDQRKTLKMIASENYSSLRVQLAMGNWLTDKYAEGFPFHRFYAGCDNVDAIEDEASRLLRELFQVDHAYVQPHSGADANLVAFWAILTHRVQGPELQRLQKKSVDELSPEEFEELRQLLVNQKLMGLSLSSGGHLTHGYRHNVSSKIMKAVFYDVDRETGLIDYDVVREKAKKEKPTILLAGYSAYPRKINFKIMKSIARDVGATLLVDMAHFAGLVAGGVFTDDFNPVLHADVITSTTHKTLRGPRGGIVMCTNEYKDAVDKGCPLVLGGPLPHVMAAKAIAFQEAKTLEFQQYAHQIVKNSQALAEELMKQGMKITTGGTDNHLMIIDVTPHQITGRQAEAALRQVGITVNRNAIPFDSNGPWYTSGVRIGTPALTTRGMKEPEMKIIASLIRDCLHATRSQETAKGEKSRALFHTEEKVVKKIQGAVSDLLEGFVLYPELSCN